MSKLTQRVQRDAKRIYWPGVILPVLFTLSFLYASFVWGGLLRVPNIGGMVERNPTNIDILDWSYRTTGAFLLPLTGTGAVAERFVENHFGDRFALMLADPAQAKALFLDADGKAATLLRWAHNGSAWFLGGAILAGFFRPRRKGTFGSKA